MQQLNLSIIPGQDGGIIIYEFTEGSEQIPVFGGDREASTKYLSDRMAKIIANTDRKEKSSRSESNVGKVYSLKEIESSKALASELLDQLPKR